VKSALTSLLALALCACGARSTPDRDASPAASVSPEVIAIGDLVTLRLEIPHAADRSPVVPEPGEVSNVVVRSRDSRWISRDGTNGVTRFVYELTAFEPGVYVFPPSDPLLAGPGGGTTTVAVPRATLTVESVLTNQAAGPADFSEPARWDPALPRWPFMLVAVALLAALAGLAVARLLRRPSGRESGPPPPPPHVAALDALNALLREGWHERGEAEPFYVRISGIVRTYLEGRFGLRAPEQTTEEFLRGAAEAKELKDAERAELREFLQVSDLVKFARHRPGRDEMRDAARAARQFVERTAAAPADGEAA